jgi:hypothetical protein
MAILDQDPLANQQTCSVRALVAAIIGSDLPSESCSLSVEDCPTETSDPRLSIAPQSSCNAASCSSNGAKGNTMTYITNPVYKRAEPRRLGNGPKEA